MLAAMEIIIGLARSDPMTRPWMPVTNPPNTRDPANATAKPLALSNAVNRKAEEAAVAPGANDITLPPTVMNVIPAAIQPMTEAVVSSAVKLGIDRKLGVMTAHTSKAAN